MATTMNHPEDPVVANRRARLRDWINNRFGGSHTLFIASTNDGVKQLNQGELSALLRNKSFGERRARSLELMARMPPRYLDDMGTAGPAHSQKVSETESAYLPYGPKVSAPAHPPIGWPFKTVSLARIVALKKALGPKAGAAAMMDIDETLEIVVDKWERRAAVRAKSSA